MIALYRESEIDVFLKRFENRRQEIPDEVRTCVTDILKNVRHRGDEAIIEYTRTLDGADIERHSLKVSTDEMDRAVKAMPAGFMDILQESAENIRRFHEKGKMQSWMDRDSEDVMLGQRVTPLERVGIYVPGGRAAYPSSLIMTAVPALVAGVNEIVAVSPPDRTGRIHFPVLATASMLGIREVFRMGGAQAIGAMAFGTDTVPKVDKIVGPGNIYVAEAKRQVYGLVDIDMIAGPSEVVILADQSANPDYTAADLLAQAEHDPLASAICVTNEKTLAEKIKRAVNLQIRKLKRSEVFSVSLRDWSGILVTKTLDEAVSLVNRLAPEHLGLHVENPMEILDRIRNAGAIFMGHLTPETIGDYWAGPNHVLPTNQTARFASPLGTPDFQKVSSVIQYSEQALKRNAKKIITFANMEGFDGHANAVEQRLE